MRWILLLLSVVGFGFAFKSGTPGALALSLLVAFGSLVAAFLAFAAARIDGQSQTQSSRAATLVATSRGKAGIRGGAATSTTATAGDTGPWIAAGDRHDDHRGHHHDHHGHHHHGHHDAGGHHDHHHGSHDAGGSDWGGGDSGGDSGGGDSGGGDGGGGGGD